MKPYKNRIALFMTVLAWIPAYISGFLIGIVSFFGDGSFVAGFVVWTYAFVGGSAALALSEVIRLLGSVNDKMDRMIDS